MVLQYMYGADMIILIDGYNVLKRMGPNIQVSEYERRAFIKRMGSYAHKKGHEVIVIFDAGPYDWIHKERLDGLTVVYSGQFQTADEFIMQYLDANQAKEILVVSSDNEIGRYASGLEVPSIGSEDFLRLINDALLQEELIADEEVSVTLNNTMQDLDEIMREASKQVPIKGEDIRQGRIKNVGREMSRTEKKLYRILKKL
jgi:predicted RNA-binding protein with PIN domain